MSNVGHFIRNMKQKPPNFLQTLSNYTKISKFNIYIDIFHSTKKKIFNENSEKFSMTILGESFATKLGKLSAIKIRDQKLKIKNVNTYCSELFFTDFLKVFS